MTAFCASDYCMGLGGAFHLRATSLTDGSSHSNELHRKWLWFAKFVLAARFGAFLGRRLFSECCVHSSLVYFSPV